VKIGAVVLASAITLAFFSSDSLLSVAKADELFAVMVGGNQIPIGSGSVNGRGSASVMSAGNGKLCFAALVVNIDHPVEFHIHTGVAGQNGPDIIQFVFPGGPIQFPPGNPTTASGCISGVPTATIKSILQSPRKFYINVHTKQFPEGAIRGQLF
jgi:hypothetical protein